MIISLRLIISLCFFAWIIEFNIFFYFFLDSPEFQNVRKTIFVRLDGPITITCNASGIPVPEMKLAREGKDLKADTTQDSVSSSLLYRINKTSTGDIGVYSCIATNKFKSEQINITLSGKHF